MEKHFELLENDFKFNFLGVKLFRIKSTKKTKYAEVGDLGGYIEKLENIYGNAWVSGNAMVSGNAEVSGDAWVYGNAEVSGDAWVSGNAWVYGNAEVSGDAWVYGNAEVSGDAWVSGNAWVYGNAEVSGDAWVSGNAEVSGDAMVSGNADLFWISKIGSSNRTTTFFKSKENVIKVKCGCFYGNLMEFEAKVKETHKGNKHEKEYLLLIELAKVKFNS